MSRRRGPGPDTGGRRWAALRLRIFDRDGWRCRRCGLAGRLDVHHVRAVEDGGSDELDNLEAICRDCHVELHQAERAPERVAWERYLRGG